MTYPVLPPNPNQAKPPFVNGSQGGTVQVGQVGVPVRHVGAAAPNLNGASGTGYAIDGGPQQPVRHVGKKGSALH
jgi:hypothetical protein